MHKKEISTVAYDDIENEKSMDKGWMNMSGGSIIGDGSFEKNGDVLKEKVMDK